MVWLRHRGTSEFVSTWGVFHLLFVVPGIEPRSELAWRQGCFAPAGTAQRDLSISILRFFATLFQVLSRWDDLRDSPSVTCSRLRCRLRWTCMCTCRRKWMSCMRVLDCVFTPKLWHSLNTGLPGLAAKLPWVADWVSTAAGDANDWNSEAKNYI